MSMKKHAFISYIDTPDFCSACRDLADTMVHDVPAVADPCFGCGESTAWGSGRYVNRVPADKTAEGQDGYWCDECLSDDEDEVMHYLSGPATMNHEGDSRNYGQPYDLSLQHHEYEDDGQDD